MIACVAYWATGALVVVSLLVSAALWWTTNELQRHDD